MNMLRRPQMGGLVNGRKLGVRVGAVVVGGLVAASFAAPANAASTSEASSGAAARQAAASSLPAWPKPPKPAKFNGCIDSTQQNNEKFLVYVPEPGQLFIWKENRGAGSVDPWVQFTETADDQEPVPVPEGIVCATITAHGNDVAVTVVTKTGDVQGVWQSDCTREPDNAMFPFDPNGTVPNGDARCTDFEELTPLPAVASGDAGTDSGTDRSSPRGPATGDGATASTSPGAATAAGGALVGLAMTAGAVALRRRRSHVGA